MADDSTDTRKRSLRARFDVYLKNDFNENEFRQIDDIQRQLREHYAQTAVRYYDGKIIHKAFLDETLKYAESRYAEIHGILGESRFVSLFGGNLSTATNHLRLRSVDSPIADMAGEPNGYFAAVESA